MNIANDFAVGLVNPRRYKSLVKNKWWRVLIYAVVFVLIGSIAAIGTVNKLKGICATFYSESVPDFSFSNSTLTVAEPFELNFGNILIAADTSKELTKEDMGSAAYGYLFDKDSMVVRAGKSTIETKYSDLSGIEDVEFTKETLYTLEPLIDRFFLLMCVMCVFYSAAGFVLGALLVAVISLIPNKMAGLRFSQLFKLSLYSRGLPIIVSWILSRFIGGLPGVVSLIISCIFMNIALAAPQGLDNKEENEY